MHQEGAGEIGVIEVRDLGVRELVSKRRGNESEGKSWTGSPPSWECKGDSGKLRGWAEHSFEHESGLSVPEPTEGQRLPPRICTEGGYQRPGRSESAGSIDKRGKVGPGVEQPGCEGDDDLRQGVGTEGVPKQVHSKGRGERDTKRQGDGTRGLDKPCPAGEKRTGSVEKKRGRGRVLPKEKTKRGRPTGERSRTRREEKIIKPPQETGGTVAGQPTQASRNNGARRGRLAKKEWGPHHGGRPPEGRK